MSLTPPIPQITDSHCHLDFPGLVEQLPDILKEVERDLYANQLCDYLFKTSQKFNKCYENCSVNKAETPEIKSSRLSLCTATAGTIRLLMSLLGIEVVERL